MNISKSLQLRLKTLKFNFDELNKAHQDTQHDSVLDSGIAYKTNYPYNSETKKKIKQEKALKLEREEKLFFHIFNFSQTIYSIKEYLREEFPDKKTTIEDFFSNEKINEKSRKDISNGLKHVPSKDIVYKFDQTGEKTWVDGRTLKHEIYMKHSWFYEGVDSVEYCNKIYLDTLSFLETEFS